MRSGWQRAQQNSREFFLDMHAVADNFQGEHGWQWMREDKSNPEGQAEPKSTWARFKDEMMDGAHFYTNDSELSDRIWLGVAASAYCAPYLVARLPYDGLLNAVEFASWRVTGEAKSPFHSDSRKTNARVIGAPVSAPLITAIALGEGAIRIAGATSYASDIVLAAHMRSSNLLSRYTGITYSAEEIKAQEAKLTAEPKAKINYIDRVGYVTLPGLVAGAELTGAAILSTGLLGGEVGLHLAGVTEYGGEIIKASHMRSANLLSRYTGVTYSAEEIKAQEAKLTARPARIINYLDRLNYLTLPGLVAGAELTGAAILGTGLLGGEVGLHLAGVTEYGGDIIKASHMRSANLLSRYTGLTYSAEEIKAQEAKLTARPAGIINYLDRLNYLTLPGLVAGIELGGAAILGTGLLGGEVGLHLAGVTEYGGDIIKASHMRSANLLSRYTGLTYSAEEIKAQEAKLTARPAGIINYLDRLNYLTLPGLVAGAELTGAAILGTGLLGGEVGLHLAGVTEYGGDIIKASHMRSANLLSRYTGLTYSAEEIKAQEAKLTARPAGIINYLDRLNYLTLPGLVAGAELTGAAILGTGLLGGEVGLHLAGVTEYGGEIIKASHMRSANLLSRYTGVTYSPEEIKAQEAKLTARPARIINYLDRLNYLTLPGLVAGAELTGAAILGTGLMGGEVGLRFAGVTEYGGDIIKASHMRSANLLSRYTGVTYSAEEIKAQEAKLTARPARIINYLDRLNYLTLPGLVAGAELTGAAILGTGLMGGEVGLHLAGVTEYGGDIIKASHMRSANLLSRYTGVTYSAEEIKAQEAKLTARPARIINYLDRLNYLTLPGLVAGAELTGAAILGTGLMGGEVGLHLAGVTEYGGEIIKASHMRSANLLSRYTGVTYSPEEIKAQEAKLTARPARIINYLDRLNYLTLPGLVAGAELTGAAILGTGLMGGEVGLRLAGVTEYGGDIIKASHMRSANLLSRYTGVTYSAEEIKAQEAKLTARPARIINYLDRLNYLTLPGLVAGAELTGAAILGIGLLVGEVGLHLAGVTEYGGDIIKASHMRSANLLSRYTGDTYSAEEIRAQEAKLTARPARIINYLDRLNYLTLPGLVAGVELAGATLLSASLTVGESVGRAAGISERSKNLFSIVFSKIGNMYGNAPITNLQNKKQSITAPIKNWWDLCDSIGLIFSGATLSVSGTIGAIPAAIGFSKSNWHRFNHFRHQLINDINERRIGTSVDRREENYHKAQLEQCENTKFGKAFSKVNVLNVIEKVLETVASRVAAPATYAIIRLIKDHRFGLKPLANLINPTKYNLNDPFDKVKKRFDDLQKACDVHGHLPISEGISDSNIESIRDQVQMKDNQKWYEQLKFSLLSEGRTIFSLGRTEEERVLKEFKSKFKEFARAFKRTNKGNIHQFFNNDVKLQNGEKFSYEAMVSRIEGTYSSQEEKQRIRRAALLIRKDIEREMSDEERGFKKIPSESKESLYDSHKNNFKKRSFEKLLLADNGENLGLSYSK